MKVWTWRRFLGTALGAVLVSGAIVSFLFGTIAILDMVTPKAKNALTQSVEEAYHGPTPWTIGNNSYIPIPPVVYDLNTDRNIILRAEQEFESNRTELRVLSYEKDLVAPTNGDTRVILRGINVHHELR